MSKFIPFLRISSKTLPPRFAQTSRRPYHLNYSRPPVPFSSLRRLGLELRKPPQEPFPNTPSFARRWQSNQPWGRYPAPRRPQSQYGESQHERHTSRGLLRDPFNVWIAVGATGSALIFYFTHIEEAPVSGRKRFMFSSEKSVEEEGAIMYQRIMADAQRSHTILPDRDRRVVMVRRVMERLITASHLEHVNFEVNVLNSPGKYYVPCLAP